MKLSQGASILAWCLFVGAFSADGAFWNRKQPKEESISTAEPPGAYAITQQDASPQVRSLSSSPRDTTPPEAISTPAAGGSAPVRRAHARMQGQEAVDTLVQLAESRRLREQEILVLARLKTEKEGELSRMNQRLLDRFGIDNEANYQYDNETKSLFLLVPREGADATAGGAADDLFEKRLHRTLDQKETEIEFVRLVSAKKITASEIQVIQLLLKEKDLELKKVHSTLEERYAISPEKHYEFDADTRTLFEVMSPAGGVSGGNPGR